MTDHRKKVRVSMSEWQIEMKEWDELSLKAKSHALDCAIEEAQFEVSRLQNGLDLFADEQTREFLKDELLIANHELSKLIKKREKFNTKLVETITELMIENARNYPIDQLLDIKHGKSKCINHEPDTHPSMNCKNNFAFCHTCGFHGDSIDIYMRLHGCGFADAVKALQ